MLDSEVEATIQVKYEQLAPYLNETSIRIWAAVEALSLGDGEQRQILRRFIEDLHRTSICLGDRDRRGQNLASRGFSWTNL
jgi:HEAT repeat protein